MTERGNSLGSSLSPIPLGQHHHYKVCNLTAT